ncbi:MAG: hypothetical protein ACTSVI_09765 [Promethearchaeota archaeon]
MKEFSFEIPKTFREREKVLSSRTQDKDEGKPRLSQANDVIVVRMKVFRIMND